jgi:hypothetical protein
MVTSIFVVIARAIRLVAILYYELLITNYSLLIR